MRCNLTGKVRHRNRRLAKQAQDALGDWSANIYWCKACRGHHLGHSKQDRHNVIRMLLKQHEDRMKQVATKSDNDKKGKPDV